MLATLGDLVEDVVVRVREPINVASDTESVITRRRGGSAATVAVVAARLGFESRFIGQVGADPTGNLLIDELRADGVDVSAVRQSGTTGTIVALVDATGERSMLTDRRACLSLSDPDQRWLEGVTMLHVPLYSLLEDPLAATSNTLIDWARKRSIPVSIDASSTAIIEAAGVPAVRKLILAFHPKVLFANNDEADLLGLDDPPGDSLVVIKRGASPALVIVAGSAPIEVPALPLDAVADTTGAGDAFAAGFLTHGAEASWRDAPVDACRSGHSAAMALLTSLS